jgi:hypothetical protein
MASEIDFSTWPRGRYGRISQEDWEAIARESDTDNEPDILHHPRYGTIVGTTPNECNPEWGDKDDDVLVCVQGWDPD